MPDYTDTHAKDELFRTCVEHGYLESDEEQLLSANLNPRDKWGLAKHVPLFASCLAHGVARVGIDLDYVAGIPTGGIPYAKELATRLAKVAGKEISLLSFEPTSAFSTVPVTARSGRVLIVDDVIYTGFAAKRFAVSLQEAGYTIVGFAFPAEVAGQRKDGSGCRSLREFGAPTVICFDRNYPLLRGRRAKVSMNDPEPDTTRWTATISSWLRR